MKLEEISTRYISDYQVTCYYFHSTDDKTMLFKVSDLFIHTKSPEIKTNPNRKMIRLYPQISSKNKQ